MKKKPRQASALRRWLILAAKLLLTAAMLWLVIAQADLAQIEEYLRRANPWYLLLGLIALNLGQVISGLRQWYYFKMSGLETGKAESVALYYAGMLLNLVLPGGIGGDGYKAWYAHRHWDFHWAQAVRLMISARASGLVFLAAFTLLLAYASPRLMGVPYAPWLNTLALLLLFPCYSIAAGKLLREPRAVQLGAAKYSALVQGSVVATAVFLLWSVGHRGPMVDYLILFMISNIVAVIPVSVGGVGLRELTFFHGAGALGLHPELGVAISVLYFAITSLASLMGALCFGRLGKMNRESGIWNREKEEVD